MVIDHSLQTQILFSRTKPPRLLIDNNDQTSEVSAAVALLRKLGFLQPRRFILERLRQPSRLLRGNNDATSEV